DHELALMIEALGGTVPALEPADELVSLDELSKQLNVSTKTVRRWRKLGLVGRRVLRNGKRQVCYQQSVISRFLASNQETVARGSKVSQMSEAEREDILRRAQRVWLAVGNSLTVAMRPIARRLGRAHGLVRYTS